MTYVSKKEKVFALPENDENSSISLSSSEAKLKRFASVSDRRAWTLEDCQRYQHLYGLVNGSEANLAKSSSFKYIPFDVLLAILMAEKDAYIQELLEKQGDNREEIKLYKSDGYEDSDDDREALIRKDAEVVALKNKIAGLQSELEDYKDTVTKAMHRLEGMEAVINENNFLKEKIKCSGDTIKYLEDKKGKLLKELEYYKKTVGSNNAKKNYEHVDMKHLWKGEDGHQFMDFSAEKDSLVKQVQELQKELETARKNADETEVLRKASEEAFHNLKELSKENECYKQRLESMKYLEKNIEELKKQGQALTDKYRRESQKANDFYKQIQQSSKELEQLRKERDDLHVRLSELMSYESQYMSLKSKLHQVQFIIDENEMLNRKLIQLDRLELENDKLKIKIEQLKNIENQAVEDGEKIMQLQCVVVEQEDEIRKLLKQIDEFSESYQDKNEIYHMRIELEEKDCKLKRYEKQLNDIPVLELEIDKLKTKLQKCIEDFKADKDLLRRLQEELEACRKRCHELEEMSPLCQDEFISKTEQKLENKAEVLAVGECQELCQQPKEEKLECADKGENTTRVEKQEAESQSDKLEVIDKNISTVDVPDIKIQIIEKQNQILKSEVDRLTFEISQINLEKLNAENIELKSLLETKEREMIELNEDMNQIQKELKSHENLKEILVEEVELLKEKTGSLEKELSLKEKTLNETREFLDKEKKEKKFAENVIRTLEVKLETEKEKMETREALLKLQKEEANLAKQEIYLRFANEINSLNNIIFLSKKLNEELTTENEILREMKDVLERYEIRSLKSLITRLRAEVEVLKGLSKPELQGECETLHHQVKKLITETDNLMHEISQLKLALDSEKKAKESLEKEVMNLQESLSSSMAVRNAALEQEVSAKECVICNLQKELVEVKNNLENSLSESQTLKNRNEKLTESVTSLEYERKELKNQINLFRSCEEELKKIISEQEERLKELSKKIKEQEEKEKGLEKTIREQEEKEKEYLGKAKHFEEISALMKTYKEDLSATKESASALKERINELEVLVEAKEESLKLKEEELESEKNVSLDAKNELNKLKSEMDVLRSRLEEKNPEVNVSGNGAEDLQNYEKDLEEKYALEEALRKLENELDGLKMKLKECKTMEEEMSNLRCKRDSLLEKMFVFESEIENLKKKLGDFENLKNELDALKARKNGVNQDVEISNLYQQLLEQKNLISNLKKENERLKEEKIEKENLLQIYKNMQYSFPDTQMSPTAEFFTPPPLLSPRTSDKNESNPETIEMEIHKKEINELENRYEQKIQNILKTNAERLKKLNENYEKEARCRTKIYYESINTIKSNYENDIKKLVEKHKVSIMRLQGLHEDEVQELNTTYETQMEAMQTQNENLINDLRTETAEKCKLLREQHNRDIRDLTIKYEELFKEKEAIFSEEKSKVEATLAKNVKEVHQQQTEDLKRFYQSSLSELEEKHSQELKKLKKSDLKRIELIKNKYEALLVEERKKYEEQLEEMLIQLKSGQKEGGSEKVKKKPPPPISPSLDFHEVLQKILNEGLECLTIEELILVHSKTCFIPQAIGIEDAGDREFSSKVGDGCRHRMLMTAEKEELLKRIFTLEHEIVIKQLETHEAIINMEAAEMCRIQELKDALCSAQQKNAELKQLLSNQTKYEMDLKIDKHMLDRQASLHETNIMQKVKELEKMKAEKRRLEEDLQMEKTNLKNLTSAIEAEKERHQIQRKRDAEYVQSMRQRLEEALNHEQKMETRLDYEVKLRMRLEAELKHLEQTMSFIPDLHSPPIQIEIKSAKSLSNQDQSEVKKEAGLKRSKSRQRSKLKAINNL